MNEKTETKQEIIHELNADPDAPIDQAVRAFYLRVRQGPNVVIPAGTLLRLTDNSRRELFFGGKIRPTYLKDHDVFVVVRSFRHTTEAGEWLDLRPGQRLRLSVAEAEELLRKNLVTIANMED